MFRESVGSLIHVYTLKAGTGIIKCNSLVFSGQYVTLRSEAKVRSAPVYLLRTDRQLLPHSDVPSSRLSLFLSHIILVILSLLKGVSTDIDTSIRHSSFVFGRLQVQISVRRPAALTDAFRGFSQSLQPKAEIVPEMRLCPLPSTSFPIHYLLIIL
jgi:hypothetical protein